MALDFDPIYHTEAMVKILREQGSTQYAMELAESILKTNPNHAGVAKVLEELREEARKNFERFKNSGRPEIHEEAPQAEVLSPDFSQTSEEAKEIAPNGVSEISNNDVKAIKASRLKRFLKRIQEYRRGYETSQT